MWKLNIESLQNLLLLGISLCSRSICWAVCINHTVSHLIYTYTCENSLVKHFGTWHDKFIIKKVSFPLSVLQQNYCQDQFFSDVMNHINYQKLERYTNFFSNKTKNSKAILIQELKKLKIQTYKITWTLEKSMSHTISDR